MHPAEAILDAVLAAVEEELEGNESAYLHRSTSVSNDEIPCVCVNYGEDTPDTESQTLNTLGSSLEVILTAICAGDDESEVKADLLAMRSATHRAMASLAVDSAWYVQYAGCSAPQLDQRERMVGELTSRWLVRYQMSISDPE